MPSDSPSQGSRRHFHRGRRGHDRRGSERRSGPPQQQPQHQSHEQQPRGGDGVDAEQIMREIRAKIAQRHGVELTDQQVQELAARRLESILDPRTIKPSLLDQLRQSAGTRPSSVAAADRVEHPFEFEDTTLYDSPNAFTRFIRKLLNPILKLFFNPNPLIRALHIQSRLNVEAAKREAERDERQAEWNALHYELLHRIVKETAKVSLEVQSLALEVESLSTKVDFNERRVRGIEGAVHQVRPSGGRERDRDRDRDREPHREREREPIPAVPPAAPVSAEPAATAEAPAAEAPAAGEGPRRRRRRRRGRRGGGAGEAAAAGAAGAPATPEAIEADEPEEGDEGTFEPPEMMTSEGEPGAPAESAPVERVARDTSEIVEPPAPERVTPQLSTRDPATREEVAPEVPMPAAAATVPVEESFAPADVSPAPVEGAPEPAAVDPRPEPEPERREPWKMDGGK